MNYELFRTFAPFITIIMMTAQLSSKLTSANTLLTFLIVALHSNMQQIYPMTLITDMAVPTFFCISAFLYFQNWQPTRAFYLKKLSSRFRSLFIPYILYNVLFYIYYIIKIYVLHIPVTKNIPTAPLDAVLCILGSVPDGPLWFIRALLFFVLLAPLFGLIIRAHRLAIIPMVIAGIVISRYFYYDTFPHWITCFSVGCFFALYQDEVTNMFHQYCPTWLRQLITNRLFLLGCLALCCLFFYQVHMQSLPYYLFRIAAPFWFLCFYIKSDPMPASLVRIAHPYTFYAFGIHVLFIWNINGILTRFFPSNTFLEFLIQFLGTIILIYLSGLILKRISCVWALLTGFRN